MYQLLSQLFCMDPSEHFLQEVYNIYKNTKLEGQIFAKHLAKSNKTY